MAVSDLNIGYAAAKRKYQRSKVEREQAKAARTARDVEFANRIKAVFDAYQEGAAAIASDYDMSKAEVLSTLGAVGVQVAASRSINAKNAWASISTRQFNDEQGELSTTRNLASN